MLKQMNGTSQVRYPRFSTFVLCFVRKKIGERLDGLDNREAGECEADDTSAVQYQTSLLISFVCFCRHAAIPTLIGNVDPRRFYTFTHGQGSMASNAFYDADTGIRGITSTADDACKRPCVLTRWCTCTTTMQALSIPSETGYFILPSPCLWSGIWIRPIMARQVVKTRG